MTDDKKTIENKIRKAKTDPFELPETLLELNERPEAQNLINIYASLNDCQPEDVLAEFSGLPFSKFKPRLSELAVSKLAPISEKIKDLLRNKDYIDSILREGSIKARKIANPILKRSYEIVGLIA